MSFIKAIYLVHKKYKKKKLSFPPPKYFTNGFYYFEIETADGILGYGEISSYVNTNKIKTKIYKNLLPIIKKNKNEISCIEEKLLKNLRKNNDEVDHSIISAFLQAILDINGKIKKISSYKLFKGYKKKIKVYASGGVTFERQNYESLIDEMIQAKEKKFFGWKFRPSTPHLLTDHHLRIKIKPRIDLEKLIKICRKLRNKAGNDFKLMIDLGCRLKSDLQSLKFLKELNELNFFLIEEPFSPIIKDYSSFKSNSNFSLGESFYKMDEFLKFSKLRCIKYLQPDFNRIPIKKLLDHQNKMKRIIIHNWTHSISFYTNINAALILNKCDLIEYNTLKFPNEFNFLKKNFFIKKGFLYLKEKYGLGIELIKNKNFMENKIKIL